MPSPTGSSTTTSQGRSGSTLIDALLGGTQWVGTVTYSFPEWTSLWSTSSVSGYGSSLSDGEPWRQGFEPLSSSDRGYFVDAVQKWTAVANLNLVQVTESSVTVGDIRAAYTSSNDGAQAWAYFPSASPRGGDVWINPDSTSGSDFWSPGSYPYLTAIHELGHALGLKHPFSGTVTLPTAWDSTQYTIMSYSELPGVQGIMTYYPTTPMLLDIQAIQYIYGANTSWHAGADTYVYADSSKYNETIWDAGGLDTIRYDGSAASSIDLTEGHGSAIGQRIYAGASSASLQPINNVWIAYGAQIENATGGSGGDTLVGNALDNVLQGRGGNDTIDGGAGTDTAVFSGRFADYSVNYDSTGTTLFVADKVAGRDGTDRLTGIEQLQFSDGTRSASSLALGSASVTVARADQLALMGAFRAFDGAAPSSFLFSGALEYTASHSVAAYAGVIALEYTRYSGDTLAARVMDNFGFSAATLGGGNPSASYAALRDALSVVFSFGDTSTRGQVVTNIVKLLPGLEANAVYGAAARTFDARVAADLASLALAAQAPSVEVVGMTAVAEFA